MKASFFLIATLALAFAGPARAETPAAPAFAPGAMGNEPKAGAKPDRVFSLQLGSYTSVRLAGFLRKTVSTLAPARIDQIELPNGGGMVYRVLLGTFDNVREAEEFATENRLYKLFPKLWIDPVQVDASKAPKPGSEFERVPDDVPDQDPYTLKVDLHCAEGGKYGEYLARFSPNDEHAKGRIDVDLHWNCGPGDGTDWSMKDLERNPSYLGFTAFAGSGSLSAESATAGSLSRSIFAYGIQLSAFRSFRGVGPTLEYRLTNSRFSGDGVLPSPLFDIDHRFFAGARLPFAHRFELEPQLGLAQTRFFSGATPDEAAFHKVFVPQVGARVRARVLEITGRASIDLAAGYRLILPTTDSVVSSSTGSNLHFQVRARHFAPSHWGGDWYMELERTSVGTRDAQALTQGETRFSVGATFLGLW
jgi:hypothetical protein